ncbi:hypothetical protein ACQP1K_25170 [Sphaerimonospora sp. CA-214678]|uniref:hypothetical protein n=1 Tax=Sphaerimonospora sp. CA-214678 TaxID=3240029 RepID=UPI003D929655
MDMPFGVVQDMPGVSEEDYRMVEKHLGPNRPPGLVAHVAGPTSEGWRVVNIWEDETAFRRFQSERLMRAAGLAAEEEGFPAHLAARFRVLTVDGAEMPFR